MISGMSNALYHTAASTSHFFTIRLADRSSDLLIRRITDLRHAMRETKARRPFHIDAICILPATIHMLWTLPEGDHKHAARIAMLKSRFSRSMPMPCDRTLTQIQRGEKGIWQRSHWEHAITDTADFERHRDMIYLSPVQAGLCPRPQDWTHTSLHRDLRKGYSQPVFVEQNADALQKAKAKQTAPQESVMHS